MKTIPCFILVRKNSKGIKNKNLIKIGNKSLLKITIDFVKKSKYITHIVVSTDDERIAKFSKKENVSQFFLDQKIKFSDTATSEIALKHALEKFENKFNKVDIVAYVQVTEPFRPPRILDKCVKNLIDNIKIDSCFAAFEQKKNFWISSGKYLERISPFKERFKPRQKKVCFREDTGISLATRSKFIRAGERIGKRVKCVGYSKHQHNIDINSYDDLKFARK